MSPVQLPKAVPDAIIIGNWVTDTSLPCAVFLWDVYNDGDEAIDVSIMFTFKNGQGDPEDKLGGVTTSSFTEFGDRGDKITGIAIHQALNGMPCTCAIGVKEKVGCHVTYRTAFDPLSSGKEIWQDLVYDGDLDSFEVGGEEPTLPGEELACAVCCRCSVSGRNKTSVERYTRYFGMAGDAFHQLLHYALNNYGIWEEKIDDWQQPILENKNLPSWYKSALFNELYFISDGGTVWLDSLNQTNGYKLQDGGDITHPYLLQYGKFAYLEVPTDTTRLCLQCCTVFDSAYCGGMWLAAVKMYTEMGKLLGKDDDSEKFSKILEKGKQAFQRKLWNGNYYNYDSSSSSHHDSIMADQLAGHWYSLEVTLSRPASRFSSTMCCPSAMGLWGLSTGMLEMAWQVAYGSYHTCWEMYGLAYQTPEGYFDDGRYRSLGYMRPLAVWSIQYALEKYHPQLLATGCERKC
ncbi:hypothetical protein LSH36_184g11041 [Paralvinella palmiformis]|uniref:Non-lysosomal glucosylceramidase n=1 Tax=Paralvinella palmiformis TaxID=53620 RepID=A0AAD9N7G2_9ANNE|nr:hypothetical protein LSH36_184g11041 [Paralvinella palmiformis]